PDDTQGAEGDQGSQTASGESYTISNLTISITANIVYGVYDSVFYDQTLTDEKKDEYANVKAACVAGDFSGITKFSGTARTAPFVNNNYQGTMAEDSGASSIARSGRLPLGLFAENLGTIENITLDKHIVRGMEVLGENKNIIYTCMVGGFAGSNYGTIKGLTLLDSASNKKSDQDGTSSDSSSNQTASLDNKTHINGRTDVGGIIGRVSFATETGVDVVIDDMYNEGTVTGYENVGGIVGRAYVHFLNDNDNSGMVGSFSNTNQTSRKKYYHDGYKITDETEPHAMSGERVYRAKTVEIKNSINKGRIYGDDIIYASKLGAGYLLDGVDTYNEVTASIINDKNFVHAAFIGGIAGSTQDGYICDGNSSVSEYADANYYTGAFAYVKVTDCDSQVMYSQDEIDDFADNFEKRTKTTVEYKRTAQNRDCYVGGLVGYARFTLFSGCTGTEKEYFDSSATEYPLVIGRNYVGGLVGCSDESRFTSAETTSSDGYAAVNYNLVIGERHVGGIAGAAGVGDSNRSTFDFRNPAANDTSAPTNPSSGIDRDVIQNVANKGIVLGQRTAKVLEHRFNGNEEGLKEFYNNSGFQGAASIGGVVGTLSVNLQNADNIQSESTKKYELKLIGFSDDDINGFAGLSADRVSSIEEDSLFGGNRVGGIVGSVNGGSNLNKVSTTTPGKTSSEVDAIVFGQDFVGGGYGFSYSNQINVCNIYPVSENGYSDILDGMVVIGRDAVGGLIGCHNHNNSTYFNSNQSSALVDAITTPYNVYGRMAVGGILGAGDEDNNRNIKVKIALDDSSKAINVNGIAYVGGIAGILEHANDNIEVEASGIASYGKYFVGGSYGAVACADNLDFIKKSKKTVSSPYVKADIFAGGIAGVLYKKTNAYTSFFETDKDDKRNALCNEATGILNTLVNTRLQGTDGYVNAVTAFSQVVKVDTAVNEDTAGNNIFCTDADENNIYTLDMAENSKNYSMTSTIEAELFAGGLFGYIPENSKLIIKNFENNGNIKATGYVGGDSGETVSESVEASDKYAYLGGVVGRVPKGVYLDNCKNLKKGSDLNSADGYYTAANATYLGGLTEVNAGVIQNCVNDTAFSYGSGGVGAFAGMNGTNNTTITDDKSTGLITKCKNNADITSTNGFAGGMAAADSGTTDTTEGRKTSAITECVNIGKITGVEVAGMVPHSSGMDMVTYCRNYGVISKADSQDAKAYGIAGDRVGLVTKNLEAGGLSDADGNDPIAPMVSANLTNNFFISGYTTDVSGSGSGSSSGPIDITNSGTICFNIEATGRLVSDDKTVDSYYDKTESDNPVYIWFDSYNNIGSITYNVWNPSANVARGVKMRDFDIVFGHGSNVDNKTYVFNYSFHYRKADGTYDDTDLATAVVEYDENVKIYKLNPPKNVDIFSVTLNFDYALMAEANNNQGLNVQYCCAYFTDAKGKHYVNSSNNPVDLTITETDKNMVSFSASIVDGMNVRTDITKDNQGKNGLPKIYGATPSNEKKPENFSSLWLGAESSNKKRDIELVVASPQDGLDAKKIRVYWLSSPEGNDKKYEYMVALSYTDENGEEQTVYRYLKHSFPTIINWNWDQATLFYDDISATTLKGEPIKPTKIEILIDYCDASGNAKGYIPQPWYFGAVTWFDKNGNERYVVDSSEAYDGRETSGDSFVPETSGYVDGATYKEESQYEDWQTAVDSDHWSKQLVVNAISAGNNNLTYARKGVIQSNLMANNYEYDPNLANTTAQQKYETFDTWFMKEFIDAAAYFGEGQESRFVNPTSVTGN
nr:hypothetical protein [Eubacterium sp.]